MTAYCFEAIFHESDDGGYWVEFPDLPGCLTEGKDMAEAAHMAVDAAKTYVASLVADRAPIPQPTFGNKPGDKAQSAVIAFETDSEYVSEECITAAEAARRLGVTNSRITQLIDSGKIKGYRHGRATYVSIASIEQRQKCKPLPGRPKVL